MSTIIGNDKELIRDNIKYPDYKKILGNREKVRSDLEVYKNHALEKNIKDLEKAIEQLVVVIP
jgi:hypothetical protein